MPVRPNKLFLRIALAFFASAACWYLLSMLPAAMQVERAMQRGAHSIIFPDFQQSSGLGTLEHPYMMLQLQESKQVPAPFVIATGDDPDRIFDANPLSPSDYAVLLESMNKSGVTDVMIASPLTWQQADPFALEALEIAIAKTRYCVTSAPVTRAAETDPLPAAMVRAAIPLTQVRGNFRTLPQVNRLAIAEILLGKEKSWAGFSSIESESQTSGKEFLLARWGDQVIFSSSLLAVCVREGIRPTDLLVDVGISIFSPRTGHWWAIDEFGRCNVTATKPSSPDLLAHQLIRPETEDLAILNKHQPPVHILHKASNEDSLQGQQKLLQHLYAAPRVVDKITWHRLSVVSELLVLLFMTSLAILIVNHHGPLRLLALLMLAGFWIFTVRWGATWLPLSPTLLACLVAWRLQPQPIASPDPLPSPDPVPTIEITETKLSQPLPELAPEPLPEPLVSIEKIRPQKRRKKVLDDDISPQLPLDGFD